MAVYLCGLAPIQPAALLGWMLYASLLSAQTLLVRCFPALYSSQRHWLVMCFKFSLAACLLYLIPTSVLEPIHSYGSFAKMLILGGGVVAFNCTGWYNTCTAGPAQHQPWPALQHLFMHLHGMLFTALLQQLHAPCTPHLSSTLCRSSSSCV